MNPISASPLRSIAAMFISALALVASVDESVWSAPLGDPLMVTAHFDLPNGPFNAGHRGIDVSGFSEIVRAPTAGVVTFSGTVVDRPVLSIRVDEQTIVSFEPVTSDLDAGDPVSRGQAIGTIARGGHCSAECLHLGVRVNGEYVNPMRFFKRRPVLLPW